MTYRFSLRSRYRLSGVHPALLAAVVG